MALLWAAGGILLGIHWWRARPELQRAAADDGSGEERGRFGSRAADRSVNRLQAMRLAYAVGAVSVASGLVAELEVLLGAGIVLLNLGTAYRYLIVALDREGLQVPLLERTRRGLLGDGVTTLPDTA